MALQMHLSINLIIPNTHMPPKAKPTTPKADTKPKDKKKDDDQPEPLASRSRSARKPPTPQKKETKLQGKTTKSQTKDKKAQDKQSPKKPTKKEATSSIEPPKSPKATKGNPKKQQEKPAAQKSAGKRKPSVNKSKMDEEIQETEVKSPKGKSKPAKETSQLHDKTSPNKSPPKLPPKKPSKTSNKDNDKASPVKPNKKDVPKSPGKPEKKASKESKDEKNDPADTVKSPKNKAGRKKKEQSVDAPAASDNHQHAQSTDPAVATNSVAPHDQPQEPGMNTEQLDQKLDSPQSPQHEADADEISDPKLSSHPETKNARQNNLENVREAAPIDEPHLEAAVPQQSPAESPLRQQNHNPDAQIDRMIGEDKDKMQYKAEGMEEEEGQGGNINAGADQPAVETEVNPITVNKMDEES